MSALIALSDSPQLHLSELQLGKRTPPGTYVLNVDISAYDDAVVRAVEVSTITICEPPPA